MTEQPKMTLPNGDVLRDGDWGVTREGKVVQVSRLRTKSFYPWETSEEAYDNAGRYNRYYESVFDIIARACVVSTRPADEMDLTALCKPFGLLHEETQAAMEAWPHGIEAFCSFGWRDSNSSWLSSLTYRAKPAPAAIRATIPWEFLVSDIQWVAMDEDGSWYGFFDSVYLDGNVWCGDEVHDLSPFTFPQGNEHWTETLQQRPDTRTEGSI